VAVVSARLAAVEEADAVAANLARLAALTGVATEYWDWQGRHVAVPRHTLVAVLAGLGLDAADDEAVEASLAAVEARPWRRVVPPVTVLREGAATSVALHVARGTGVRTEVVLEGGGTREPSPDPASGGEGATRDVDGVETVELAVALPGDLPVGYHEIVVTAEAAPVEGEERADTVHRGALVVVPHALPTGARARQWGVMAQLYQVRSELSWGHGDFADLAEVAGWAARAHGAGFVLVNPLHAPDPTSPVESSPYLPSSRRFVSPLYIRVEDVRETAYLPAAERAVVEWSAEELRARNRRDDLLDRDAVWAAKLAALEKVYAVPRSPSREAALRAYVDREGPGLQDWATWCALREHYGEPPSRWPDLAGRPDLPGVASLRDELAERIRFHCWLQWVADEQLAAVQRQAREAGMALGVVHELAVGVHPDGAEAWALQDCLARGVTVGAPPDAFNQVGQDWSQPPWRPDALAERAYAPYRDMLRSILRHCSGLRIDHVMGLFRLWWIPDGAAPGEGTYVYYDAEALVGILVLEAMRAGAVVVGEDLGNVEPGVRDHLRERGVLGTSILWFEKDDEGRPRRPQSWRELCLATVATHDLPPAAGYLAGEHLAVREELGLLTRSVADERAHDEADRRAFVELLLDLGLLPVDHTPEQLVDALHRMLTWTPARLVGVALADLVGDHRAVNQPGTNDEYPNWRLPLTGPDGAPVLVEDLVTSERAAALAAVVAEGL
jgi:4-alpha-glucanotransferase